MNNIFGLRYNAELYKKGNNVCLYKFETENKDEITTNLLRFNSKFLNDNYVLKVRKDFDYKEIEFRIAELPEIKKFLAEEL